MTLELSRHDRLVAVEKEIVSQQHVIDTCMGELNSMRDHATELIEQASRALQQRDELLKKIEDENLWADDFSNVEEYYDSIGLSRQRNKQIRDRVIISRIVNSVDAVLPPVSDLNARSLSRIKEPEVVVRVFSVAAREANGDPPSPRRVEFLVDATMERVNVEDGEALRMYEESRMIERCLSIYNHLSEQGKQLLKEKLQNDTED